MSSITAFQETAFQRTAFQVGIELDLAGAAKRKFHLEGIYKKQNAKLSFAQKKKLDEITAPFIKSGEVVFDDLILHTVAREQLKKFIISLDFALKEKQRLLGILQSDIKKSVEHAERMYNEAFIIFLMLIGDDL